MINFERSSITDGTFTPEGVTHFSLKSSNLSGRGEITTYLPPSASGIKDLPFYILLHGVYGSHFSWFYQGGAGRVLDRLVHQGSIEPALLVMPSDGLQGDGTGYLCHKNRNFEKWITDDVIAAIRHRHEEITPSSLAFISGLSMGGYGALRIGMKYHQFFSGISAHSSITDLDDLKTFIEEEIEELLHPDDMEDSPLINTAIRYKNKLPSIRFDCGIQDPLILSNRRLHDRLSSEKIMHQYQEFEGAHSYEYWHKHIADTFSFFDAIAKKWC